ncbi:MAG: ImmA/IrrE family metallo-endopeptidase [Patescibacteria group bacterium]
MTNSQIEKLAEKVFAKLGDVIPVDMIKAARLHDIDVFVTHMEKTVGATPSGILVEQQKKWAILLNIDDTLTRQRFTIAHEIGHFLIHKGKQFVDEFTAGETFYRDGSDNEEEQEANYFAACLLMPEEEVERIWPQCKDPKDAAVRFKVSEVSMTYRLKKLGLITVEE